MAYVLQTTSPVKPLAELQKLNKMRLPGVSPQTSQPALHQLQKCQGKTSVLDDIVSFLRRLLRSCLSCLTCGCYPDVAEGELQAECYGEAELTEEERQAVQLLLQYFDDRGSKPAVINNDRLQALCVLTYSDNVELQRSAALCYAEFSISMIQDVSEIVVEPLVVLLRSRDTQVQRAASLAISNFSINGPDENKTAIVNSDAIKPLVQLMSSDNVEVQVNTCGCITTLATNDHTKQQVLSAGGVKLLLELAQSTDVRVQRNATGALLNLTHSQSHRNTLVYEGALPVLVSVLHSSNADVQYYCAAALSNLAINERHRVLIVALGHYDCMRRLIKLLASPKSKVKCQACLALRNLASDSDHQMLIAQLGCLPELHAILRTARGELLIAALACLRNLSIHMANEMSIVEETFLIELKRLVRSSCNSQAQIHAAGTIRNLSAGDQVESIIASGCVEALIDALHQLQPPTDVLVEVSAALAVLADEEETKQILLAYNKGNTVECLIYMATDSENSEVCYNCAGIIGQLSLSKQVETAFRKHSDILITYFDKFLRRKETGHVHIALWTVVQLLEFEGFGDMIVDCGLVDRVRHLATSGETDAIQELSNSILLKMPQC